MPHPDDSPLGFLYDGQPRCCLLHADFHELGADCWQAFIEFDAAHDHLKPDELRDAYQAAWELALLEVLFRQHSPGRRPIIRG